MELNFPNLPSPGEIQGDIDEIVALVALYERNIAAFRSEVRRMMKQQRELRALVEDPGFYEVDALKANVAKLDGDIARVRAAIQAEREKIVYFKETILPEIRERMERSEAGERLGRGKDDGQNGHNDRLAL